MKKGAEQRQSTPRTGQAPWHTVVWITAITVIFSVSTMTLAALAQSPTTGYARNVTGILQALRDLRREVREIGIQVIRVEEKMVERGLIPATPTSPNVLSKQAPENTGSGSGPSRNEETPVTPPVPKEQVSTPPPSQEPNQPPAPQAPPPPPAPKPDPVKEKNLQICLDQCNTAFAACVKATNETPVTTGYSGDDPICIWNNDKECKPLCTDWYFYPAPSKPPVPPIESAAQTCLLDCRTKLAGCFKEAGKDLNKLNYCILVEDPKCRINCPAWNENSKY